MADTKTSANKARPAKKSNQNPISGLLADVGAMIQEVKAQGWGFVRDLEKFRDIEKNNYDLGHRHLALGNVSDAVLRFRFVTWLNPKRADAFYYLGCSYLAGGKKSQARAAFLRALALKPEYEEAMYMMALVSDKSSLSSPPKRMPLTLAREYFDAQAINYTHDQLRQQGYEGHVQLTNAIRSQLTAARMNHVVLDMGVGTGLCGPLMRDVASQLTGVDISDNMLAVAATLVDKDGKQIYDALIHQDLETFLRDAQDGYYDIVMAATVFSYIGDLSGVFAQVPRVLKAGGLFAFSVDSLAEGSGYAFDAKTAYFRFSMDYVNQQAAQAGLTPVKATQVDSYPENPAWLCIYKK